MRPSHHNYIKVVNKSPQDVMTEGWCVRTPYKIKLRADETWNQVLYCHFVKNVLVKPTCRQQRKEWTRCVGTRRKYSLLWYSWAYLISKFIFHSTLSNPRVSERAKQHAHDRLNELGGDKPREELFQARGDRKKDPTRVAAGYKAWV